MFSCGCTGGWKKAFKKKTLALAILAQVREQLSNLGFPIPTPEAFQEAIHGVGRRDEPRLKQLTLQEALQPGHETKDRHDVIEVKDTPLD